MFNTQTNVRPVSFGKAIPIKKVIIDGIEICDVNKTTTLLRDLGDVLTKNTEHKKGDSIRKTFAKKVADYTIPTDPINNRDVRIVEFHVEDDMKYLVTGKEANDIYGIGYWKWRINHDATDVRISSNEVDEFIKQLDEAARKIVTNPDVQLKDNFGLVLHGKKVPANSYYTQVTGESTTAKLTGINFTA
jgi:hypothetical protein